MGSPLKKEDIELFENMDFSRLKNIVLFISFLGYTYYLTRLF
jgi:hypothetical protein